MSDTPKTTAERLAAVMASMGAVAKDRQADAQMGGYSFRGIEDVANAVHPLLADNGLVLVAETLDHTTAYRQLTTNGGRTRERRDTLVHVRYSVRGPSGDAIVLGDWWGEGDAYDDKGTNKAYSAAMKLCLLQAFVIPTVDLVDTEASVDTDAGSPSSDATVQMATNEQLQMVAAMVKQLDPTGSAELWKKSKARQLYAEEFGNRAVTLETVGHALRWLEEALEADQEAATASPKPNPATEARKALKPEEDAGEAEEAPPANPDALEVDEEPF